MAKRGSKRAERKKYVKWMQRKTKGHFLEKAGPITSANTTYNTDGTLKSGTTAGTTTTPTTVPRTSVSTDGRGGDPRAQLQRGTTVSRTSDSVSGGRGTVHQVKSTDSIGSLGAEYGMSGDLIRGDLIREANPSTGPWSNGVSLSIPSITGLIPERQQGAGLSAEGTYPQALQEQGQAQEFDIARKGAGKALPVGSPERYGPLGSGRVGVGRDANQFQGVSATGTHYDAGGRLVNDFGEETSADTIGVNSIANMFNTVSERAAALGVTADYFAGQLPATLPPQIASRMFDLDMADPNALSKDMAAFGYEFNPATGLYEQGISGTQVVEGGGAGRLAFTGGGWNWDVGSPPVTTTKPLRRTSVNMMNWRLATG